MKLLQFLKMESAYKFLQSNCTMCHEESCWTCFALFSFCMHVGSKAKAGVK